MPFLSGMARAGTIIWTTPPQLLTVLVSKTMRGSLASDLNSSCSHNAIRETVVYAHGFPSMSSMFHSTTAFLSEAALRHCFYSHASCALFRCCFSPSPRRSFYSRPRAARHATNCAPGSFRIRIASSYVDSVVDVLRA